MQKIATLPASAFEGDLQLPPDAGSLTVTPSKARRSKFFLLPFAVILALSLRQLANAQDTALEARNKAVVLKSFDAWRGGTGSPFDLLAEQASWTVAGNSVVSRTYPSREAFMAAVIRPFNARMSSPLRPSVHRIYADKDSVVIYFDAEGMARDRKPYHNTYTWLLDLRDGKIVRAVAFFDALEFNSLWDRVSPATR